jgi:FG-GAP-like repeat
MRSLSSTRQNGRRSRPLLLERLEGRVVPSFLAPRAFGAGGRPSAVALGDVNGDGLLDLAVANEGSNNVSVLLGNGDGTFQAARHFPAGSRPLSVAVGDVSGDGHLDLAVANFLRAFGKNEFMGPRTSDRSEHRPDGETPRGSP